MDFKKLTDYFLFRFGSDEDNYTDKPEIINMNRLFNSKKVSWQDNSYVEEEEKCTE